jgi:methyl-accepting chemotaxis protein
LGDTTDHAYLARVASAMHSGTKDISYSDGVTSEANAGIESAKKTKEIMISEENKKRIDIIIEHIENYEHLDDTYRQLQIQLVAKNYEQFQIAKGIDEVIERLINILNKHYETMEKEGKPLTMVHVSNCGKLTRLLETVESIRRAYRDLVIALINPKKVDKKDFAYKEITATFEELNTALQELQETLLSDEAKNLVISLGPQQTKWQEIINEVVEINMKQGKSLEDKLVLANDLSTIAEELTNGVKSVVENVKKDSASLVARSVTIILAFVIFATIFGLLCAFVLTTNITTGLKYAVTLMKKVAGEGDLSLEVEQTYLQRKDELGQLAQGLRAVLQDYHSIDGMANSLAGGDWRVAIKSKGDLDSMNINLSKMVTQVNQALAEINESVKQVATGAGEVSSAATTLSSGAQESAASLEEITASMSEISSQTKANAQSAGEARDLAQKATHAAAEGQAAMQQMTEAMGRITKNSDEINRVIKVIDDIAFQTNLLALNAAVEAARAGAHGKGFAVVAEEVRNLAARSAKAAKETTDLISTSGQEIQKGGEVASRTSEVLNSIVEQIKQTTELVAGIAIASNEQAQGVSQVTIGLQQIDAVTQQNTAAAEESASAANEMSGMASTLQHLVAKFQLRT